MASKSVQTHWVRCLLDANFNQGLPVHNTTRSRRTTTRSESLQKENEEEERKTKKRVQAATLLLPPLRPPPPALHSFTPHLLSSPAICTHQREHRGTMPMPRGRQRPCRIPGVRALSEKPSWELLPRHLKWLDWHTRSDCGGGICEARDVYVVGNCAAMILNRTTNTADTIRPAKMFNNHCVHTYELKNKLLKITKLKEV